MKLLTANNIVWQGDICKGCTYPDADHGLVNLAANPVIRPYGPVVYLSGNDQPVTATVDSSKEQDGAELQIFNAGKAPVMFAPDASLNLATPLSLAPGRFVVLHYDGSLGKFTLKRRSEDFATAPAVQGAGKIRQPASGAVPDDQENLQFGDRCPGARHLAWRVSDRQEPSRPR